jgi:hypothetical protein
MPTWAWILIVIAAPPDRRQRALFDELLETEHAWDTPGLALDGPPWVRLP